jgi:hypothetical protein
MTSLEAELRNAGFSSRTALALAQHAEITSASDLKELFRGDPEGWSELVAWPLSVTTGLGPEDCREVSANSLRSRTLIPGFRLRPDLLTVSLIPAKSSGGSGARYRAHQPDSPPVPVVAWGRLACCSPVRKRLSP